MGASYTKGTLKFNYTCIVFKVIYKHLGCYYYSKGRDYAKAATLYQTAADEGNPEAMYRLGNIYSFFFF